LPSHIQVGRIDARNTTNEGNKGNAFAVIFLVDLLYVSIRQTSTFRVPTIKSSGPMEFRAWIP
jgi:hypothetical protein